MYIYIGVLCRDPQFFFFDFPILSPTPHLILLDSLSPRPFHIYLTYTHTHVLATRQPVIHTPVLPSYTAEKHIKSLPLFLNQHTYTYWLEHF